MARKTVIVGAGLGGLAAAVRLAAAGREVAVFDSRPAVGGKAGENTLGEEEQTWRFDTGPSLLTLPGVLDELFAFAGRDRKDYLDLEALDPITRYWFDDGSRVESSPNRDKFAASLEAAGVAKGEELDTYLDYSRRIWNITHDIFMERSLHEPSDLLRGPELWKSIFRLGRIDALRSMDAAHRRFFSDGRAQQFFNRYATYNGSNPYAVPATLNIIPHVEYGIGGFAVKGGIVAIPRALERLARELGVEIHLNEKVERILTEGRPGRRFGRNAARVVGVRTSEDVPADEVVCNADVTTAYRDLLNDTSAPLAKRYRRLEPSSSGLVFFWAMGSDYPEFGLHNILFSSDYTREFGDIFERRRMPDEPTVYINITSKVDRSDAPSPGENWFVLVNAPPDEGQEWHAEADRTRKAVLSRIEKALGRDVSGDIRHESILDPPAIAAQTSSHRGSLYGISSNSPGAAFLRHPNRSHRYRGLYFAGGSAHPGGGMPLVMLSGKIAAELVLKNGGRP
jgi:phytoene desaturase